MTQRLRLAKVPTLSEDAKHVRLQLSLPQVAQLLVIHNVPATKSDDVTADILHALFKWGRP